MRRAAPLALLAAVGPAVLGAQRPESLVVAGRPWHVAEALLAAHAREPRLNAALVVEGAKAELGARRYDRAQRLLAGQPWLEEYADGEALAVLAEAEANLGQFDRAGEHFAAARVLAGGARAALLAVREGVVWEALGDAAAAARAYGDARSLAPLASIDPWLRVREARVVADTVVAFRLLAGVSAPVARVVPATRARARLAVADSAGALTAFEEAGLLLEAARLALALRDSTRAREAVYRLFRDAPQSDDAAAAVGLALGAVPPRGVAQASALARAMRLRGSSADAAVWAARAVRGGDSSAATLLLLADLQAASGRLRDAAATYALAARDTGATTRAAYRRARILLRLGDPRAEAALSGFAERFPQDSAAPTALYVLADYHDDRGTTVAAERWFAELIGRYPADPRASLARFRLALRAQQRRALDSAAALYRGEIDAGGPQRLAARFWLGDIVVRRGDSALAQATWTALAREDSLGYYGLRARREARLPAPTVPDPERPAPPAVVDAGLARIDTLVLAGLDSEARAEVREVAARPPADLHTLLCWSEGLAARGWGPWGVRLAWQAFTRAPTDPRVVRAIYPWPNRAVIEMEAAEFGVDPLLLAALVRQESVFDPDALSPAGARGLAQLLAGTAAQLARGLDLAFAPGWLTVPDLNLHLGAAHLAELLRRFGGRVEVALAAYNAGSRPVNRWLARPGATEPDQFIELIPFPETRGYVRSVLRNRELYRVMYAAGP